MSPVDYPNPAATYYSISILENIGVDFGGRENCVRWLSNFKIDSIYSLYYVVKSLILLGHHEVARKKLLENFSLVKDNIFFSPAQKIYEIEHEFKRLYFVSELSTTIGCRFGEDLIEEILAHANEDGGFGLIGHSTLTSTYYVVGVLNVIGSLSLIDKGKVVGYVRKCERPEGGFVTRPENILPYMEYTYYGVKALEIFGEKVDFPLNHIKFVLRCLNKDGGFRRTVILGISNLENVYYASSLLKALDVDKFISW